MERIADVVGRRPTLVRVAGPNAVRVDHAVQLLAERVHGTHPSFTVREVYVEVMRAIVGMSPWAADWVAFRDYAGQETAVRGGPP